MFYEVEIEDIVRVPPVALEEDEEEAIRNILISSYTALSKKEIGMIITIKDIKEIDLGVIVPEDGGIYYRVRFTAITFKPEINEILYGIVSNITEFGAFINIGPLDGLVHVSQIMDDEVTISGKEAIVGKKTKNVLKLKDLVKARVISVSYKDILSLKVALTMKQPGLGKIEWLEKSTAKK
ncbi:MAG: DNA-directed RNA polymerase [Candidatus Nanoclepta minutus]|uniref:DNA-directed RNA polymerase subunit Rpo7 n=1 Tax=Candidatus Nanoclepta minutus TaxID=1940235 RepID=A0A397WQ46_9ARCH|nr:MAG: DNA-directed RNA polymerase [Candidatus Nanoclepta minutus]